MNKFDFKSEGLDEKLALVRSKATNLSWIRILVFFGIGALVILGLTEHPLWLILAVFAVSLFVSLVGKYNFQRDQEAIFLALRKMEERQLDRQKRNLSHLDSGSEYSDKLHPFANDLDLFGEHSLFQLLNHTVSPGGKDRLAALMKSGFDKEESEARAKVVEELASKRLFLQAMEAAGLALKKEEKTDGTWVAWLNKTQLQGRFAKVLAIIGPIGGLALLVLIYAGVLPGAVLGLWVLMGVAFLSTIFQPLKEAAEAIPMASTLKSYRVRAELIEQEVFASKQLQKSKAELCNGNTFPSVLLRELDRLGLWVQNRLNLLYLPINLIFWIDFFLLGQLFAWRNKVGQSLSHLPENLEKWEVLVSLGAFEVELEGAGQFGWTEDAQLSAVDLVHPLIETGKAVANSIDFDAAQRLILLTGANMSGKTTFMRTLGINCVLVNLGLRPFGKSLTLGKIGLYTSMRNSDNLGESISSFYAELKRIRILIERLEAGEVLFFLLDEILKGTNTQDRISGSEALIRQILQTKGIGIMSTHDIELSGLSHTVENLHNFSFHSEINNQSIDFDYKIKKGPCPSFNAHKLMELMGIRFGNR